MSRQDNRQLGGQRVVALRDLKSAIARLDDEGLLDQRAIDRVYTAALGTMKRECTAVLRQRERDAQQMKLEAA